MTVGYSSFAVEYHLGTWMFHPQSEMHYTYGQRGLLKFESRVSSIKTRVSSNKNGHIRCSLLIQLILETSF